MLPILLALAFLAMLFIVVAAGQPDEFKISRSTNISASPDKIFPHINDLHQWEAWSPWAKRDPACQNSYDGSPAGTGAIFAWAGNQKVGEGRMMIIESLPNELIRIKLEFFKPFKATHAAEFKFKSEGPQTVVTWSMSGTNNVMGKAFGLFMNCDKMVGGDFEKGLAQMKLMVETGRS